MEGPGGKKRSLHHYFPSQTKKKKSNENEEVQGKELTQFHAHLITFTVVLEKYVSKELWQKITVKYKTLLF